MTDDQQTMLVFFGRLFDIKVRPIDIDGVPGVSYPDMITTNLARAMLDLRAESLKVCVGENSHE